MVAQIVWSERSKKTFENNISCLQKNWSEKEISNFVLAVDNKLNNLSSHPYLGSARSKNPNIRFTSINKRVALIYHYKPRKKEIELLFFWSTHQNPDKLKNKN